MTSGVVSFRRGKLDTYFQSKEWGRVLLSWGNISICWYFKIPLMKTWKGRSDSSVQQLNMYFKKCFFFCFIFSLFFCLYIFLFFYLSFCVHLTLLFSLQSFPVFPHISDADSTCEPVDMEDSFLIRQTIPWTDFSLYGAECAFCSFPLCFQHGSLGPHRTWPTPLPWALQKPDYSDHTFHRSVPLLSNASQSLSYLIPKFLGFSSSWSSLLDTHQYMWILFKLEGHHMDQYSSSGLGNTEQREPIISLVLLATSLLMKPICKLILSIYTVQLTYSGLINKNSWFCFC